MRPRCGVPISNGLHCDRPAGHPGYGTPGTRGSSAGHRADTLREPQDITRACANCGSSFAARNVSGLYCSHACGMAGKRANRRSERDRAAVVRLEAMLPCCRDYAVAQGFTDAHGRTRCPQHQDTRRFRAEQLVQTFARKGRLGVQPEDWLQIGFNLSDHDRGIIP